MENGQNGIPKGVELRKFKYYGDYPVVVKYVLHEGVSKIGDAYVPLEKNINNYIPGKLQK